MKKNFLSELGFSQEHSNLNILRNGYVASEITKSGASNTAPRREVRDLIEPHGGFSEILVSTSLEVCEQRDRKGLVQEGALEGIIKEFTGISDPYEESESSHLPINTSILEQEKEFQQI